MTEFLQKQMMIQVHQKLYEKPTSYGKIEVYQTTPYGIVLTLNGHILISEHDSFLYHEMMAHPALFTHPHPQSVAILGPHYGILQEVLKHPHVKQVHCISDHVELEEAIQHHFPALMEAQSDPRVQYHVRDTKAWLKECQNESFDILIQNQAILAGLPDSYQDFFARLRKEGILIEPCQISLLESPVLKPLFQTLELAGFHDWQMLHFPQPSYSAGWRTAMMAIKHQTIKRIREKDIFNRNFSTRYYNFDTHKAALALPEFMRAEWEKE
jgi:spermidine synthase